MRSVLTIGGIPTFVSSQEHEFIESFGDKAYGDKLDEREAEIAKMLTSRGVLERRRDEQNKIYYTKNQNKGII